MTDLNASNGKWWLFKGSEKLSSGNIGTSYTISDITEESSYTVKVLYIDDENYASAGYMFDQGLITEESIQDCNYTVCNFRIIPKETAVSPVLDAPEGNLVCEGEDVEIAMTTDGLPATDNGSGIGYALTKTYQPGGETTTASPQDVYGEEGTAIVNKTNNTYDIPAITGAVAGQTAPSGIDPSRQDYVNYTNNTLTYSAKLLNTYKIGTDTYGCGSEIPVNYKFNVLRKLRFNPINDQISVCPGQPFVIAVSLDDASKLQLGIGSGKADYLGGVTFSSDKGGTATVRASVPGEAMITFENGISPVSGQTGPVNVTITCTPNDANHSCQTATLTVPVTLREAPQVSAPKVDEAICQNTQKLNLNPTTTNDGKTNNVKYVWEWVDAAGATCGQKVVTDNTIWSSSEGVPTDIATIPGTAMLRVWAVCNEEGGCGLRMRAPGANEHCWDNSKPRQVPVDEAGNVQDPSQTTYGSAVYKAETAITVVAKPKNKVTICNSDEWLCGGDSPREVTTDSAPAEQKMWYTFDAISGVQGLKIEAFADGSASAATSSKVTATWDEANLTANDNLVTYNTIYHVAAEGVTTNTSSQAGECAWSVPSQFNIKSRPKIAPEAAQVDICPGGYKKIGFMPAQGNKATLSGQEAWQYTLYSDADGSTKATAAECGSPITQSKGSSETVIFPVNDTKVAYSCRAVSENGNGCASEPAVVTLNKRLLPTLNELKITPENLCAGASLDDLKVTATVNQGYQAAYSDANLTFHWQWEDAQHKGGVNTTTNQGVSATERFKSEAPAEGETLYDFRTRQAVMADQNTITFSCWADDGVCGFVYNPDGSPKIVDSKKVQDEAKNGSKTASTEIGPKFKYSLTATAPACNETKFTVTLKNEDTKALYLSKGTDPSLKWSQFSGPRVDKLSNGDDFMAAAGSTAEIEFNITGEVKNAMDVVLQFVIAEVASDGSIGCTETTSLTVKANGKPVVNPMPDIFYCPGAEKFKYGHQFSWDAGHYLIEKNVSCAEADAHGTEELIAQNGVVYVKDVSGGIKKDSNGQPMIARSVCLWTDGDVYLTDASEPGLIAKEKNPDGTYKDGGPNKKALLLAPPTTVNFYVSEDGALTEIPKGTKGYKAAPDGTVVIPPGASPNGVADFNGANRPEDVTMYLYVKIEDSGFKPCLSDPVTFHIRRRPIPQLTSIEAKAVCGNDDALTMGTKIKDFCQYQDPNNLYPGVPNCTSQLVFQANGGKDYYDFYDQLTVDAVTGEPLTGEKTIPELTANWAWNKDPDALSQLSTGPEGMQASAYATAKSKVTFQSGGSLVALLSDRDRELASITEKHYSLGARNDREEPKLTATAGIVNKGTGVGMRVYLTDQFNCGYDGKKTGDFYEYDEETGALKCPNNTVPSGLKTIQGWDVNKAPEVLVVAPMVCAANGNFKVEAFPYVKSDETSGSFYADKDGLLWIAKDQADLNRVLRLSEQQQEGRKVRENGTQIKLPYKNSVIEKVSDDPMTVRVKVVALEVKLNGQPKTVGVSEIANLPIATTQTPEGLPANPRRSGDDDDLETVKYIGLNQNDVPTSTTFYFNPDAVDRKFVFKLSYEVMSGPKAEVENCQSCGCHSKEFYERARDGKDETANLEAVVIPTPHLEVSPASVCEGADFIMEVKLKDLDLYREMLGTVPDIGFDLGWNTNSPLNDARKGIIAITKAHPGYLLAESNSPTEDKFTQINSTSATNLATLRTNTPIGEKYKRDHTVRFLVHKDLIGTSNSVSVYTKIVSGNLECDLSSQLPEQSVIVANDIPQVTSVEVKPSKYCIDQELTPYNKNLTSNDPGYDKGFLATATVGGTYASNVTAAGSTMAKAGITYHWSWSGPGVGGSAETGSATITDESRLTDLNYLTVGMSGAGIEGADNLTNQGKMTNGHVPLTQKTGDVNFRVWATDAAGCGYENASGSLHADGQPFVITQEFQNKIKPSDGVGIKLPRDGKGNITAPRSSTNKEYVSNNSQDVSSEDGVKPHFTVDEKLKVVIDDVKGEPLTAKVTLDGEGSLQRTALNACSSGTSVSFKVKGTNRAFNVSLSVEEPAKLPQGLITNQGGIIQTINDVAINTDQSLTVTFNPAVLAGKAYGIYPVKLNLHYSDASGAGCEYDEPMALQIFHAPEILDLYPERTTEKNTLYVCADQEKKFTQRMEANLNLRASQAKYQWTFTEPLPDGVTFHGDTDPLQRAYTNWFATIEGEELSRDVTVTVSEFVDHNNVEAVKNNPQCPSVAKNITIKTLPIPKIGTLVNVEDGYCKEADISALVSNATLDASYTLPTFPGHKTQAGLKYHYSYKKTDKIAGATYTSQNDSSTLITNINGYSLKDFPKNYSDEPGSIDVEMWVTDTQGCGYEWVDGKPTLNPVMVDVPAPDGDPTKTVRKPAHVAKARTWIYGDPDIKVNGPDEVCLASVHSANATIAANDNRKYTIGITVPTGAPGPSATSVTAFGSEDGTFSFNGLTDNHSDNTYKYTLTVTDNSGCPSTADKPFFNLTVHGTPTFEGNTVKNGKDAAIVLNGKYVVCVNEALTITVAPLMKNEHATDIPVGDYTYVWKKDGVEVSGLGANDNSHVNTLTYIPEKDASDNYEAGATYTVEVSKNGCTYETQNFEIVVKPLPRFTLTADKANVCEGGEAVTLTATNDDASSTDTYSYALTLPADCTQGTGDVATTNLPTQTSNVWQNLYPTAAKSDFGLKVTDKTTGCHITYDNANPYDATATVNVNPKAKLTFTGADPTTVCAGQGTAEIKYTVAKHHDQDAYITNVTWTSLPTGFDQNTDLSKFPASATTPPTGVLGIKGPFAVPEYNFNEQLPSIVAKTDQGCDVELAIAENTDIKLTVVPSPDAPEASGITVTPQIKEGEAAGKDITGRALCYNENHGVLKLHLILPAGLDGQKTQIQWYIKDTEPKASDAAFLTTTGTTDKFFQLAGKWITSAQIEADKKEGRLGTELNKLHDGENTIWVRYVSLGNPISCPSEFTSVKLKVNPIPGAPEIDNPEVCYGGKPVITIKKPLGKSENGQVEPNYSYMLSGGGLDQPVNDISVGKDKTNPFSYTIDQTLGVESGQNKSYNLRVTDVATQCYVESTLNVHQRKKFNVTSIHSLWDENGVSKQIQMPDGTNQNITSYCDGSYGVAKVSFNASGIEGTPPTTTPATPKFTVTETAAADGTTQGWEKEKTESEALWKLVKNTTNNKVWTAPNGTVKFTVRDYAGCKVETKVTIPVVEDIEEPSIKLVKPDGTEITEICAEETQSFKVKVENVTDFDYTSDKAFTSFVLFEKVSEKDVDGNDKKDGSGNIIYKYNKRGSTFRVSGAANKSFYTSGDENEAIISTITLNAPDDAGKTFVLKAYNGSPCASDYSNEASVAINLLPTPSITYTTAKTTSHKLPDETEVTVPMVCLNDNTNGLALSANAVYSEYEWTSATGFLGAPGTDNERPVLSSAPTTKDVVINPSSVGAKQVTLKVKDDKGCVSHPVTQWLKVRDLPVLSLTANTVCEGEESDVVITPSLGNATNTDGISLNEISVTFTNDPTTATWPSPTLQADNKTFKLTNYTVTGIPPSYKVKGFSDMASGACPSAEVSFEVPVIKKLPTPTIAGDGDDYFSKHQNPIIEAPTAINFCERTKDSYTIKWTNSTTGGYPSSTTYTAKFYSDAGAKNELKSPDYTLGGPAGTISFVPKEGMEVYCVVERNDEPKCKSEVSNKVELIKKPIPAPPSVGEPSDQYVCIPAEKEFDVTISIGNAVNTSTYKWLSSENKTETERTNDKGTEAGTGSKLTLNHADFGDGSSLKTTWYYAVETDQYGCKSSDYESPVGTNAGKSNEVSVTISKNPTVQELTDYSEQYPATAKSQSHTDICSGDKMYIKLGVEDAQMTPIFYTATDDNSNTYGKTDFSNGVLTLDSNNTTVYARDSRTYTVKAWLGVDETSGCASEPVKITRNFYARPEASAWNEANYCEDTPFNVQLVGVDSQNGSESLRAEFYVDAKKAVDKDGKDASGLSLQQDNGAWSGDYIYEYPAMKRPNKTLTFQVFDEGTGADGNTYSCPMAATGTITAKMNEVPKFEIAPTASDKRSESSTVKVGEKDGKDILNTYEKYFYCNGDVLEFKVTDPENGQYDPSDPINGQTRSISYQWYRPAPESDQQNPIAGDSGSSGTVSNYKPYVDINGEDVKLAYGNAQHSGYYSLEVTSNGCVATDSVYIQVMKTPVPTVTLADNGGTQPGSVCSNGLLTVTGTQSDDDSYYQEFTWSISPLTKNVPTPFVWTNTVEKDEDGNYKYAPSQTFTQDLEDLRLDFSGEKVEGQGYIEEQISLSVKDQYGCESVVPGTTKLYIYSSPVIEAIYGNEGCADNEFRLTVKQDKPEYSIKLQEAKTKDTDGVEQDTKKTAPAISTDYATGGDKSGNPPTVTTTEAFTNEFFAGKEFQMVVKDEKSGCFSDPKKFTFNRYDLKPKISFSHLYEGGPVTITGADGNKQTTYTDYAYYCEGEDIAYSINTVDAFQHADFLAHVKNIKYTIKFYDSDSAKNPIENNVDDGTGTLVTYAKGVRKNIPNCPPDQDNNVTCPTELTFSFAPTANDAGAFDENIPADQILHPMLPARKEPYTMRVTLQYEFDAYDKDHPQNCGPLEVDKHFVILPNPQLEINVNETICQSDMNTLVYTVTNVQSDVVQDPNSDPQKKVKTEYHFKVDGNKVVSTQEGYDYTSNVLRFDDPNMQMLVPNPSDANNPKRLPLSIKNNGTVSVTVNMNYQSKKECTGQSSPVTFFDDFNGHIKAITGDQCRGEDIKYELQSLSPTWSYLTDDHTPSAEITANPYRIKWYQLHVMEGAAADGGPMTWTPLRERDADGNVKQDIDGNDILVVQTPVTLDPEANWTRTVLNKYQYAGDSKTIGFWFDVMDEKGCKYQVRSAEDPEPVKMNLFEVTDIAVSKITGKDGSGNDVLEEIKFDEGEVNDLCAHVEYVYTIKINDVDGNPLAAPDARYVYGLGHVDWDEAQTTPVQKAEEYYLGSVGPDPAITDTQDPKYGILHLLNGSANNSYKTAHDKTEDGRNSLFIARVKDTVTGCEIVYRKVDPTAPSNIVYRAREEEFKFHAQPVPDLKVLTPNDTKEYTIDKQLQQGYDLCYENKAVFEVMGPKIYVERHEHGQYDKPWNRIAVLEYTVDAEGKASDASHVTEGNGILSQKQLEVSWSSEEAVATDPDKYKDRRATITLDLVPEYGWQQYRFVVDDGTCEVETDPLFIHKRQSIHPVVTGLTIKRTDPKDPGTEDETETTRELVPQCTYDKENTLRDETGQYDLCDWDLTLCEADTVKIKATTMEWGETKDPKYSPTKFYFELYDSQTGELLATSAKPAIDLTKPVDYSNTPYDAEGLMIATTLEDAHPERELRIYADFGSVRDNNGLGCAKTIFIHVVPTPTPGMKLLETDGKVIDGLLSKGHNPSQFEWVYKRCDKETATIEFEAANPLIPASEISITKALKNGTDITGAIAELGFDKKVVEGPKLSASVTLPYDGNDAALATPNEATKYEFFVDYKIADCPKTGHLTIYAARNPEAEFQKDKPKDFVMTGADLDLAVDPEGYIKYLFKVYEGADQIASDSLNVNSYTFTGDKIDKVPANDKLHICVVTKNAWYCEATECKDVTIREGLKARELWAKGGQNEKLNTKEAVYCSTDQGVHLQVQNPQNYAIYYVVGHPEMGEQTMPKFNEVPGFYQFPGWFRVLDANAKPEEVEVRAYYAELGKTAEIPMANTVKVEEVTTPDNTTTQFTYEYIDECKHISGPDYSYTTPIEAAQKGVSYFVYYSKTELPLEPKTEHVNVNTLLATATLLNPETPVVPTADGDYDMPWNSIAHEHFKNEVPNGYYYIVARNTSTIYESHKSDPGWTDGTLLCPVALPNFVQVEKPETESFTVMTDLEGDALCEDDKQLFSVYIPKSDYKDAASHNGKWEAAEPYEYYLLCNGAQVPEQYLEKCKNPQESTESKLSISFRVKPEYLQTLPGGEAKFQIQCKFSGGCDKMMDGEVDVRLMAPPTRQDITMPNNGYLCGNDVTGQLITVEGAQQKDVIYELYKVVEGGSDEMVDDHQGDDSGLGFSFNTPIKDKGEYYVKMWHKALAHRPGTCVTESNHITVNKLPELVDPDVKGAPSADKTLSKEVFVCEGNSPHIVLTKPDFGGQADDDYSVSYELYFVTHETESKSIKVECTSKDKKENNQIEFSGVDLMAQIQAANGDLGDYDLRTPYSIYVHAVRTTHIGNVNPSVDIKCEYDFPANGLTLTYYPQCTGQHTVEGTPPAPNAPDCEGWTIKVVNPLDYPEVNYVLYKADAAGKVDRSKNYGSFNVGDVMTKATSGTWEIKFTKLNDKNQNYVVVAENGACDDELTPVVNVHNNNVPDDRELNIDRLVCEGDAGTTAKIDRSEANVTYSLHYVSFAQYDEWMKENGGQMMQKLLDEAPNTLIDGHLAQFQADDEPVIFDQITYRNEPVSTMLTKNGWYYIMAEKAVPGMNMCPRVLDVVDFMMLDLPQSFILDRTQFFCDPNGVTVSLRNSEAFDGTSRTVYRLFEVNPAGKRDKVGEDIPGTGQALQFPGLASNLQDGEYQVYSAMALKTYTLPQGVHTCTSTMEGIIELTKAEPIDVLNTVDEVLSMCDEIKPASFSIPVDAIATPAGKVNVFLAPPGTHPDDIATLAPLPWNEAGLPTDPEVGLVLNNLPDGTSKLYVNYEGNSGDCLAELGRITVDRHPALPENMFDKYNCGTESFIIDQQYVVEGARYYIVDKDNKKYYDEPASQTKVPITGLPAGELKLMAYYGPDALQEPVCQVTVGTFKQYPNVPLGSYAGDPDVLYSCNGVDQSYDMRHPYKHDTHETPIQHDDVLVVGATYVLAPIDREVSDEGDYTGNDVYRMTYKTEGQDMIFENVKCENDDPRITGDYRMYAVFDNNLCATPLGFVSIKKSPIKDSGLDATLNCSGEVTLNLKESSEGVKYMLYQQVSGGDDLPLADADNVNAKVGDELGGPIEWTGLKYTPKQTWLVKASLGDCENVVVASVNTDTLKYDIQWDESKFFADDDDENFDCESGLQRFELTRSMPGVKYYLTRAGEVLPDSERDGVGGLLEWFYGGTGENVEFVLHAFKDNKDNCSHVWPAVNVNFDAVAKPDIELQITIEGYKDPFTVYDVLPTICPGTLVTVNAIDRATGGRSANVNTYIFHTLGEDVQQDLELSVNFYVPPIDQVTSPSATLEIWLDVLTNEAIPGHGGCVFHYDSPKFSLHVDNGLGGVNHLIALPDNKYCPGELGVKLAYTQPETKAIYRLYMRPDENNGLLFPELMDIQEIPRYAEKDWMPNDTLFFSGWGYGANTDIFASEGTYFVEVTDEKGCSPSTKDLVVEQYAPVCKSTDSLYVASVDGKVIDANTANSEYGVIGMNIIYHLGEPDQDIEYFLVKSDTILLGRSGPVAKFVSYDKPKNNKTGYWDGQYQGEGWTMQNATSTATGLELNFGTIGNLGKRSVTRDGKSDFEYFIEQRLDTIGAGDGVYCVYAYNRVTQCECNICEVIIGGEPLIAYDVEIYMNAKNNSQTVQLIPSYPNKSNHQYIGWSSMLDRVYLPIITTDPQGYWINAGSSELNYDRSTGYVSKPGKYDPHTGRYLGKNDESNVWFELLQPNKETGEIPGHPELETKKIFGSYGLLNPDFTSEASADRIVNDEPLPTGFFWYQKLPSFYGQEVFYYRLENKQMPGRYSNIAKITVLCGNADTGDDQSMFLIPNAFSPNGDGLNDVFKIIIPDKYQANSESKLQVFNRWGTLVYRSQGLRYGEDEQWWDGKSTTSNMVTLGEDLPSGTYYYVFTITFIDKANATKSERKMNGYIELRR